VIKKYSAVAALALVAGCGGTGGAGRVSVTSQAAPTWSAAQQVATTVPQETRDYQDPVEVKIPKIGVRSGLERVVTDANGFLVPPSEPAEAGWFAAGTQPGDPGPAVIAGHLDSKTGAAVFTRLGELRHGDEILIKDKGGATVRFRVDEIATYPKDGFPTAAVYGPTPDVQLRLITCGGQFDESRGHYKDNLIVYASVR
jgi:LPXTG-site transpeptidase (sortase) family protein